MDQAMNYVFIIPDKYTFILAGKIGKQDEVNQMRVFLALITQIFLNQFFKHIKHPLLRHLYSMLVGLTLLCYLIRSEVIHLIFMAIGVYFIMKTQNRMYQHKIAYVFSFGYLMCIHLNRMLKKGLAQDFGVSKYAMMTSLNLISMSVCYRDGSKTISKELLNKEYSDRQIYYKLDERPTLLEVCSYALSSSGCILGPIFEFKDYHEFINKRGVYKQIPSNIIPTLKRLSLGIMFAIMFTVVNQKISLAYIYTNEFDQQSIFMKLIYLFIIMQTRFNQFTFAFKSQEAACISSGLGFNGYDEKTKKPKWDKVISCFEYEMNMCTSLMVAFKTWNYHIHLFMKNYIFLRMVKKGEKPTFKANLITMLVSAMWHGLEPVNYCIFFICALIVEIERDIQKMAPLLNKIVPKILNPILGWLFVRFIVSYFGAQLFSLDSVKAYQISAQWYHIPFIFLSIFFLILKVTGVANKFVRKQKQQLQKQQEQDTKKDQ